MARKSEQMKAIQDLRDRHAGEVADLERRLAEARIRLQTLDQAVAAAGGTPIPQTPAGKRQSNVKNTVMGIINEAAEAGVTAVSVVEAAAAKGKALDRNSVSSLLSRLKREKTLTFDGERYRPQPKVVPDSNVTRWPEAKKVVA